MNLKVESYTKYKNFPIQKLHNPPDNSTYDAYKRLEEILNASRDHLEGLFKKVNIPPLLTEDVAYIHEFVKVMAPVAMALDRLQGGKNMYLGKDLFRNGRNTKISPILMWGGTENNNTYLPQKLYIL